MALSMEEQRILAEMERQLAGDDPSLALRLSKFGRPGLAAGLRTPRGRVLASFLVVAVVALLSLTVYSLMPLRTVPDRGVHGQRAAPLGQSGQTAQASAPATTKASGSAASKTAASKTAASKAATSKAATSKAATSKAAAGKAAAKPGNAARKEGGRSGRPADRHGRRSAAAPGTGRGG
jgi:hypothetical protein